MLLGFVEIFQPRVRLCQRLPDARHPRGLVEFRQQRISERDRLLRQLHIREHLHRRHLEFRITGERRKFRRERLDEFVAALVAAHRLDGVADNRRRERECRQLALRLKRGDRALEIIRRREVVEFIEARTRGVRRVCGLETVRRIRRAVVIIHRRALAVEPQQEFARARILRERLGEIREAALDHADIV